MEKSPYTLELQRTHVTVTFSQSGENVRIAVTGKESGFRYLDGLVISMGPNLPPAVYIDVGGGALSPQAAMAQFKRTGEVVREQKHLLADATQYLLETNVFLAFISNRDRKPAAIAMVNALEKAGLQIQGLAS